MASSVIHLAVAKKYIGNRNKERVFAGALYPDTVLNKDESHYTDKNRGTDNVSHLKGKVNLYAFLEEHDLDDDFELGWFIHLFTDYLFFEECFDKEYLMRTSYEDFRKDLYYSYDHLGQYLKEKYGIVEDDYKAYPDEYYEGVPYEESILSKEKIDAFIARTSSIDLDEYIDLIKRYKRNVKPEFKDARKTIENDEEFLRQVSTAVDIDEDDYMKWVRELEEYCENNKVFALATVQIGIPKRIIYFKNTNQDMSKNAEDYNERTVLINPRIIRREGHTRFLEACQSCIKGEHYLAGVVDRPYLCEVEYYDLEGNMKNEVFEGFKATVFSHEYDHLEGLLHLDKTDEVKMMTWEEMKIYREEHPYEIIEK